MIKVAHVIWSSHFGGIEKVVYDLAREHLRNSNIDVCLVFGKDNKGEFSDLFERSGIKCWFLALKSGYDLSVKKYARALEIFRENDVIHFHSFDLLLSICAIASGKKLFYTEHGNFGFGRKQRWRDRLNAFFLKRFLNNHVNFLTFNSNFCRIVSEQRYKLNGVSRSVIHNGIRFSNNHCSSEEVENSILTRISNKFVVGTTSRLVAVKEIHRLVEAFALFQENKEAILLLVGDGVLRAELEELVELRRISAKTIFAGFRSNVTSYQACMDVCVFPSANEAFGIAAVETLAIGKPTIAFRDGGGLVEIISENSPEDIVDTIPDLVGRLNFYFENTEDLDWLAPLRKRYASRFSIEEASSRLETIYHQLCVA